MAGLQRTMSDVLVPLQYRLLTALLGDHQMLANPSVQHNVASSRFSMAGFLIAPAIGTGDRV